MRFHLLGLAHLATHKKFSQCAYTNKIVRLGKMLRSKGHKVFFYGVEGSEVDCDESIVVLDEKDRVACYGEYDMKKEFFKLDGGDAAYTAFNKNAINAINERKEKNDILLCPMGCWHQPIAQGTGLLAVESGIGYEGVFSSFKVFESYAWMHWVYGKRSITNGIWYDSVIPNYFDLESFPFQKKKGDYALFVGRLVQRKGLDVAVEVTKRLGLKLIVAGQGSLVNPNEKLNITSSHVEHVGCVGPEERARLMGGAQFCFAPTYYIEPFGGVAVEAQLCGTPVLTSDWGAFCVPTETQILTKRGWLDYSQVKVGEDETLGYDKESGTNKWTKITAVHVFKSKKTQEFKNRNWKFRVTDGHRWVMRHKIHNPKNPRFVGRLDAIENCLNSGDSMTTSVVAQGGDLGVSAKEAALIGWLMTDGGIETVMVNGKHRNFVDGVDSPEMIGKAKIYQSKKDGIEEIRSVLTGVPHSERKGKAPSSCLPKKVFQIDPGFVRELFAKAEVHVRGLFGFVLGLSSEARLSFLQACINAEGWKASKGSTVQISQNAGPICDAIELCAYLCGFRPTKNVHGVYKGTKNCVVSLCNPFITPARLKKGEVRTEDVWCPSTELHTWTARLGGNIVLTGNTETVLHGVTGYRCRTIEEFVWAAKNADKLKPENCRKWSAENYSVERVTDMYEAYFQRIASLWGDGWYAENNARTELDWLSTNYINTSDWSYSI